MMKINFASRWMALAAVLVLPLAARSQWDVSLARMHVDTLTSVTMAGRGYQDDGHRKAAEYIAAQFAEMGLSPYPEQPAPGMFQRFSMGVNLVDSLGLSIGKTTLLPGRDFILNAASGSGGGSAKKVRDIGYGLPGDYDKIQKGEIVVIREGLPPEMEQDADLKSKYKQWASDPVKLDQANKRAPAAVILVKKKLTASVEQDRGDIPLFEVLASQWPKKAKKLQYRALTHLTKLNSQNVIGYLPGTIKDTVVIVSAHYDHLGRQQEAIFWGGNDNASGTAMLLEMARHFAQQPQRKYSMMFVAFGGEEVGLLGSAAYVRTPLVPLGQTRFILNLDLMGNGEDGITAVAGSDFPVEFGKLVQLNDELKAVPLVKPRGNAPNSDHYHFVSKGVHGMFIYTLGGPPHYHDVNDTGDALVYSKYPELMGLLTRFLEAL